MALISNNEKNIRFEINLLKNEYLDLMESRTDFENWVPFELYFDNGVDSLGYLVGDGATFSYYEVKSMLAHFEEIIILKSNGRGFEKYEFSSSQRYFDLVLYDPLEENEIFIELWINIGTMTNGEVYGYDKGYRFVVSLDSMSSFSNELRKQIEDLK